ncbi:uridine kinase [Stackebrandtia albiflava]|uniref:Uridine kinase n=1 Tax=Stackebrandtia albiflava TaxID=406432 RepID=A0A562VAS0_9ACTN|nr:AAA family ATPase [Stackebrandtia albiflava]TWJ14907.1 uridine kinase [Stackebrandtia albiflava]
MRIESFRELSEDIMDRPARLAGVRMVAVDGPAGSGKTSFADRLAAAFVRGVAVAVLHADDLYDGWQHPTGFDARLREWIVEPWRTGRPAAYRVYDWHAGEFGAEWVRLPRPDVLIVEGVSTGGRRWRNLLSHLVYVEAESRLRLERGLARDGRELLPHLLRWREDESEYFAADRTAARADLVVDGAPEVEHDREREFVVARG